MRLICLWTFIVLAQTLRAQTDIYKFSNQIDSILKNYTTPWRYQPAAWEYSYIGEYHKAIKTFETPYTLKRKLRTAEQKEAYLKKPKSILSYYTPIPAKDYIINNAKGTRLVIINEAHHNPMHRTFVESLLPELKTLGYDYLGIETLDYNDSLLNQRKYPLIATGYYSKEPAFGSFIRTALHSGFTVFPYETKREVSGKDREMDQASNIKSIMDQNPSSKFIIYCGFDHAIEDSTNNAWIMAMAGRLKQLTGVDPLTIDQVSLTEKDDSNYDNEFRQAIDLNYSAVLIDSKGKTFNKAHPDKVFDANIYHPTTKLEYGRPQWLKNNSKRYIDVAENITIEFPCLLFAYNDKENINMAVPIDIIELTGKDDNKRLILNKNGSYKIVVTNIKGQKQVLFIN